MQLTQNEIVILRYKGIAAAKRAIRVRNLWGKLTADQILQNYMDSHNLVAFEGYAFHKSIVEYLRTA